MIIKPLYFTLCVWLSTSVLKAQTAERFYIVRLTDKNHTSYSVNAPQAFLSEKAIERRNRQNITVTVRDLPVSSLYIERIENIGANVLYASKWMNALLIKNNDTVISAIRDLSFVKNTVHIGQSVQDKNDNNKNIKEYIDKTIKTNQATSLAYGRSANQIIMLAVEKMHRAGFRGQGITIAVLDAGFDNVNNIPAFDSLFANQQILGTYDFVEREDNVYDDHSHGTQVLAAIAAYQEGDIVGTAFKANYYLFRTEDDASEKRIEEFYWLISAERADSLGVDIISSSLGYNTFDDPKQDYTTAELDGNTALITRAADWAAATGILVVTSVGNEASSSWQKITFPADADSVLSVGAVNSERQYANFSGIGPTVNNRIKPDVVARGLSTTVVNRDGQVSVNNGTSFATPLIAGLAAGIWQAYPHLTNMELIEVLRQASSRYEKPDNQIGYGIPSFTEVEKMFTTALTNKTISQESIRCYPNPIQNNSFTIYFPAPYRKSNYTISIYTLAGEKIYTQKQVVKHLHHQVKLPEYTNQNYILHLSIKDRYFSFNLLTSD